MSPLLQIPKPVKSLFDGFPLWNYPAIQNQDDALSCEISRRKFPFQGSGKADINNTFSLGVYNVFIEPTTKAILSTDPWCLYAQFALCKKNTFGLPYYSLAQDKDVQEYQSCLSILSPCAAQAETLPILVEGYNKRYIRSTDGINEILESRVNDDLEQLLYINMLDHVVYDCWITQLLYYLTDAQFSTLYSFENRGSVKELKLSLLKRNQFHLRHSELVKNIESPMQTYQKGSLQLILNPIQANCETTLLQLQDILGTNPFISTDDSAPTYFELKIASYMLCILNLQDTVPLKSFVDENCEKLVRHAQLTLSRLNHIII